MRITKFLLIAALSTALFSCESDSDNPDAPKPTLTVTELGTGMENQDITVDKGATLTFKWNALKTGGGSDLNSFELFQSGVNIINPLPDTYNGETLPITNLPNKYEDQYVDTISFNAGMNLGITTFTFSLQDKDGNLVERMINVTVVEPAMPLMEKTGMFYHVGGTLEGAYDLVMDTIVASSGSATDKDMQNTDMAGDPFTGSFDAGNATMFVMDNAFDYDNATDVSAMTAYAAGTAMAAVSNPAVGDIFIAKLRGGADYAVVKVMSIDPADNTCGCGNKGKMMFSYKK